VALEGVTVGCTVEEAVGAIVDRVALEGVTVGCSVREAVGASELKRQWEQSLMEWRWRTPRLIRDSSSSHGSLRAAS